MQQENYTYVPRMGTRCGRRNSDVFTVLNLKNKDKFAVTFS
jgi:hypothetical protein